MNPVSWEISQFAGSHFLSWVERNQLLERIADPRNQSKVPLRTTFATLK